MLIVSVKEKGGIERALKILKRKVIETKQVQQLRERESFTKPSAKRRETIKKAKYRQSLNNFDE